MPCRDYMDEVYRINDAKERLDMLSRIACKALTFIEEKCDGIEFLLIEEPEIQEWWKNHKIADEKEQQRKKQKEYESRIKESALSKLSAEERRILGV